MSLVGNSFYFGAGEVTVEDDLGNQLLLNTGETVDKSLFMDIATPADNMMDFANPQPQAQPSGGQSDPNFGQSNHRSSGGKAPGAVQGEKLAMPKEVASMVKGVKFDETGTPILPTAQPTENAPSQMRPGAGITSSNKSRPAHQFQPIIDLVEKSAKKDVKVKLDFNIKLIDQALIKAIHTSYGDEALEVVIEHLYLAGVEELKQAVIDTIKKKCKIDTGDTTSNNNEPKD